MSERIRATQFNGTVELDRFNPYLNYRTVHRPHKHRRSEFRKPPTPHCHCSILFHFIVSEPLRHIRKSYMAILITFVCALIPVTPREPLNCVYIHLSQKESILFAFLGIMRRERHADRSPSTSAEIQNERSYTSTPICLHGVNRDELTLLLGKQENLLRKSFQYE